MIWDSHHQIEETTDLRKEETKTGFLRKSSLSALQPPLVNWDSVEMGKASKKKSRRDNRGSRRSNEDLEHASKKQIGENSSIILTDLNSIDTKKRMSAIVMFKDLLIQNFNNVTVVGKLTTSDILSTLSLRLIDSNSAIRLQAVKCFLTISRCGLKFVEKIVHLGIHETLRRILEEVALSTSPESDEIIDDLLCIVYLLSMHCSKIILGSADALVALALSNLSFGVVDARKISFAEYLLNCSSDSSAVAAHQKVWINVYEKLSIIVSAQRLSHSLESLSDYFLVLLSAVATNLITSIPTLPHFEPVISNILMVLIDSLYLQHPSVNVPPLSSDNDSSMVVVLPTETGNQSIAVDSFSMGKYKTLTLKTASDALSRFFTNKEKSNDINEVSTANKMINKSSDSECVDFKGNFRAAFNTYFSISLQTAGQLAALLPPLSGISQGPNGAIATSESVMSINGDGSEALRKSNMDIMKGVSSAGEGSSTVDGSSGVMDGMFHSTVGNSSSSFESDNNVRDVLEALLDSLCTATDYAALSLSDGAVLGFISGLTGILEAQYSAFCAMSVAAEAAAAASDTGTGTEEYSEEREKVEKLRYLTTSVCECISSLVQHATVASFLSLSIEENTAVVQRLALILCRCATSPDSDISIPCIGIMGFLGVKNDLLEAGGDKGFLKSKINWLLSNSILRILDTFRDANTEAEKNVFLLEICFSSFIDLHSSDDVDILQNFKRLNSIEKLSSGLHLFEKVVNEINEENKVNKRRGGDSSKSTSSEENDLQIMLADLEETILNSRSFLEYKSNYCQ